jgi:tRNA A37 threonylcarbamoyladenosine modification protein TsaB
MDARREQVYTGLYRFEKKDGVYEMICEVPQCAISIDEIINIVNTWEQEVIFLGDGVPVYKDKIEALCRVDYSFAPAGFNRQRALSVGLLGSIYYKQGEYVSADDMQPDYLRLSQAERERMEMEEKKL